MLSWPAGFILAILSIFTFKISEASDTLRIDGGFNNLYRELRKEVWIFEDTSATLSASVISSDTFQHAFYRNQSTGAFATGLSYSVWWLRFVIYNSSDSAGTIYIEAASPRHNILELYQKNGQKVVSGGRGGKNFPFTQRPFQHRNFVFPVSLPAHSYSTFYLKADKKGELSGVPLFISSPDKFHKTDIRNNIFMGMIAGLFIILIFISLIISITVRKELFAVYALYLISMGLFFLCHYGFAYQYLWPDHINFNKGSHIFFTLLSGLLVNALSSVFLQYHLLSDRLYKLSQLVNYYFIIITSLLILGLIHPFFIRIFTPLMIGFYFLIYALVVAAAIAAFRKKMDKAQKIYFTGFFIFYTASILMVLRDNQVLPINSFTSHMLLGGSITEIIFITVALAIQLKSYKDNSEKLLVEKASHQRELLETVLATQENERSRISRDLHDELGSVLSTVKLNLENLDSNTLPDEALGHLALAREHLDLSINDVRNIAQNLIPPALTAFGLIPVIEDFINKINRSGKVYVFFDSFDPTIRFTPETELQIYRIVLEIFGNIIKHSGATEVNCTILLESRQIVTSISDNGTGFDIAQVKRGNGLYNIESRIQYMEGIFTINSQPLTGTTISFSVPINTP